MFELNDYELQEYIKGDLPYYDLTTSLQNVKNQRAKLEIFTREDVMVSCSEEAARVASLLGCEVDFYVKSGYFIQKGNPIIKINGDYEKIHQAWRLCQILLEYSCKISTLSHQMKNIIVTTNKKCELLATRKTLPFAKRFCIKAVVIGGAKPHRLGLSETILFFDGHRIVYKNDKEFYKAIKRLKEEVTEKKIVVESKDYEDAISLMESGVDVLQLDKMEIDTIKEIVEYRNINHENIKILAAGGINIKNVVEYSKTMVDGIVTSSLYTGGMSNLGSKLALYK